MGWGEIPSNRSPYPASSLSEQGWLLGCGVSSQGQTSLQERTLQVYNQEEIFLTPYPPTANFPGTTLVKPTG